MEYAINMTIQDAIQEIDGLVHSAMVEYNTKDEEDAYDEEVLGIAVWAMNKQIPIKPIEEDKEFRCGMCNTSVAKRDGYCWRCGQKQDWVD